VKSGLFWKLLLAFWVAFFTITQLVVSANNFGPPLSAQQVYAQRMAPAVLGLIKYSIERDGLVGAERVLNALPPSDRAKVEIARTDLGPAKAVRWTAVIESTARSPQGVEYRLLYRYRVGLLVGNTPLEPTILGLVVGPIFGGLLAWYLLNPIRRLQLGFTRLAEGDLAVRLAPEMGRRHDEIADLARDFDVMAEQLEQSIQARERLLHDVSHELRSPLSRLQLAIGLARQEPARMANSLDRIEYEGRRLESVVRELLSLARAEGGRPLGEDYFDITGLLESVLADARFEAEATSVAIVSDLNASGASDDAPSLCGNAELMRWALDNVIRNALRFSSPGQTVHVRLNYDQPAGRYVIVVADEGPGAPEAALPTLFDPFVRADETKTGFGLGLAVAKRAVRTHGGSIDAENLKGAGLSVTITLPTPADRSSPPPPALYREGSIPSAS